METIPDPDDLSNPQVRAAYELLSAGGTTGVFQLESEGITELTKAVQPHSLADFTALVALYRPGPLSAGYHTQYANRKHGREALSIDHWTTDVDEQKLILPVFAPTYQVLIYQEQLMQVSQVVAGFNASERSKLRKAVGKKDPEVMRQVRELFIERAISEQFDDNGDLVSPAFARSTAEALMADIEAAGRYAFNRSHSATYGFLSFVTAYLKANWPTEFAAATLAVTSDKDKRQTLMLAFSKEGVRVAAPDVNTSGAATTAAGGMVRFGLSEIRDVSTAANFIITERDANGPFASLAELATRVQVPSRSASGFSKLGSQVLVGLAESGALDSFGRSRMEMVMAAYTGEDPERSLSAEWPVWEQAARQRQRIGAQVGEHPLVVYTDQIEDWRPEGVVNERGEPQTIRPVPITDVLDDASLEDRKPRVTIGLLTSWARKVYGRGVLASFTLEAADGRAIDGVMWNEALGSLDADPIPGSVVCVSGMAVRKIVEVTQHHEEDEETVTDDEDAIAETVAVTQITASRLWMVSLEDQATRSVAAEQVVVNLADARLRLERAAATGKTRRAPSARKPKTEPVEHDSDAQVALFETPAPEPIATVTVLTPTVEKAMRPREVTQVLTAPKRTTEGSVFFAVEWFNDVRFAQRLGECPGGAWTVCDDLVHTVDGEDLSRLHGARNGGPLLLRAPVKDRTNGWAVVCVFDPDTSAAPDLDQVAQAALSASWEGLRDSFCQIAEMPVTREDARWRSA